MTAVAERLQRGWREFVGPETTPAGTAITLTLAVLGGALAPKLASSRGRAPLGVAKSVVLSVMAVDLWGGAWVNNTRACARWYERPGQTDADHLRFAAAHLHPVAIAWIDTTGIEAGRGWVPRWGWAPAHYGYLMASTALIRRARRHRRALGWVLTGGGVALDAALGASPRVRWFAPVYYGKLLLGHASAALWSDPALAEPPGGSA